MTRSVLWLPLIAVAMAASQARGEAVQLPEFRFFGVTTTVSVPDSGAGIAASMKQSSAARRSHRIGIPGVTGRPFRNDAIGQAAAAAGVHVRATSHDFEAADQALLSQAAHDAERQVRSSANFRAAAPMSIAEIRQRQVDERAARDVKARTWLDRAEQAQTSGKPKVAEVYYRMAAQGASENLRAEVSSRRERLRDENAAP